VTPEIYSFTREILLNREVKVKIIKIYAERERYSKSHDKNQWECFLESGIVERTLRLFRAPRPGEISNILADLKTKDVQNIANGGKPVKVLIGWLVFNAIFNSLIWFL
jgi:hypothetical protein